MSSFSCPHFDEANDFCLKLKTDCVPGRPGCVLCGVSVFAVPVEERIRRKAEEKKTRPFVDQQGAQKRKTWDAP